MATAEAVDVFASFVPKDEPQRSPPLAPVAPVVKAPVLVPEPPASDTLPIARSLRASDETVARFRAFVTRVRGESPALAAVLEHSGPFEVSSTRLHLGYEKGAFLAIQATLPENLLLLERAARAELGADVVVEIDVAADPASLPTSVASLDAEARRAAIERARGEVEQHPLVQRAIHLFEAELRDVRLPTSSD